MTPRRSETRVALYPRVSSKPQLDGSGLSEQLKSMRAEVERQGWTEVAVFEERGVSGEKVPMDERPAGRVLIAAGERGEIDLVVVDVLDRFSRSTLDALLAVDRLEKAGVHVVSVSENVDTRKEDDRLNLEIRLAFASEDNRKRTRRMKLGLRAKAEKGMWTGGKLPWGYRVEDGRLAVDPDEQRVAERATELIVDDGLSTMRAAERLNSESLRRRNGARWDHQTLRTRLLNLLDGEFEYGDVKYEVPPVIPAYRHRLLEEKLAATTGRRVNSDRIYTLSGKLFGPCGHPYHGSQKQKSAGVYRSAIYECRHRSGCGSPSLLADQTEGRVWQTLADPVDGWLTNPNRVAELIAAERATANGSDVTADLARVETAIADASERIDELVASGIPIAKLKGGIAKIEGEVAALERDRADLEDRRLAAEAAHSRIDFVHAVTARIGAMRTASAERQREVYDQLGLTVHVTAVLVCPMCAGKGKLPRAERLRIEAEEPFLLQDYRKRGLFKKDGLTCPTCLRTGRQIDLRMEGRLDGPVPTRWASAQL